MDGDTTTRLAYLILLLLSVSGYFIFEARANMGRTARHLLVWGLLFVGVLAAHGLWEDVRRDIAPRQTMISDGVIEVPVGVDGHYHLTLELNRVAVDFIIDTGASEIVLTQADAARVGLDPEGLVYSQFAETANGRVASAPATVASVALGEILDTNVRVSVNAGEMDVSLLGMSYLGRFDSIVIQNNTMVLTR